MPKIDSIEDLVVNTFRVVETFWTCLKKGGEPLGAFLVMSLDVLIGCMKTKKHEKSIQPEGNKEGSWACCPPCLHIYQAF
jgi:hypothetical protein